MKKINLVVCFVLVMLGDICAQHSQSASIGFMRYSNDSLSTTIPGFATFFQLAHTEKFVYGLGCNIHFMGNGTINTNAIAISSFTDPPLQPITIKSKFHSIFTHLDLNYYLLNNVDGDFNIYAQAGLGLNILITRHKEIIGLDRSKYQEPYFYQDGLGQMTPHIPVYGGIGFEKNFDNFYLFALGKYMVPVYNLEREYDGQIPSGMLFEFGIRTLFL